MTGLETWGWNRIREESRRANGLESFGIGRVVAEHRERYRVVTESGEHDAQVAGVLRHDAIGREDYPAVGDWVAMDARFGEIAIVRGILPRTSVVSRKEVGGSGGVQVIAANVDRALLVQAVDRDFNPNRLDRYLALCRQERIEPVVVLTKSDLVDPPLLAERIRIASDRACGAPVVAVTDRFEYGYSSLVRLMEPGATHCLLGSSGVGKSTLVNRLCGRELMRTDSISSSTGKGRHVTSHRELVLLGSGALLLDNPGMREVGLSWASDGPVGNTDRPLAEVGNCRFRDCTHTREPGCAVLAALESGRLDEAAYGSWRKLEKEREHFESTLVERRRKDRAFGKMLDTYKKEMRGKEG